MQKWKKNKYFSRFLCIQYSLSYVLSNIEFAAFRITRKIAFTTTSVNITLKWLPTNSNNASYCCAFFLLYLLFAHPIVCVHPKYSSVQFDYMRAYHFRPYRFLFAFLKLFYMRVFISQQRTAETLFSITTTFHGILFSCIIFLLNHFFLFEINSNGKASTLLLPMVYMYESFKQTEKHCQWIGFLI